jgi:hypothetical protein
VLEFEQKLDALRSQLMYAAIEAGWPIHKLRWKKYPSSTDRLDLMYESTRLAIIRATFEPVSLSFKWVGPEQPTLTPEESALHEKLVEAKQAQDAQAPWREGESTAGRSFLLSEAVDNPLPDEGPSAA